MNALDRLPVKLDEPGLAGGVDQPEGVDPKALHHRKTPRQRAIAHHPHQHVCALGRQRHEIPEGVVGRCGLRDLVVWLGLYGMDQVGKFNRILNEEDRHVVADEVPHPHRYRT